MKMSEFILAWVLITVNYGYGRSNLVVYSPPMQTIKDCEQLQKGYTEISQNSDGKTSTSKCVQVSVLRSAK
jgi:hypothetical protein